MSTPPDGGTAPSIRANSRKNRVYVFLDFLVKTYGDRCLKPGDVVLDVAGGKGDLSWLLVNADGIKSIVVDPRSLSSTSHLIRSVTWLQNHPDEAKERAIPHRPTHQPLAALIPKITEAARLRRKKRRKEDEGTSGNQLQSDDWLEPQHFQMKLDNALIEATRTSLQEKSHTKDGCPDTWKNFWDEQCPNQSLAKPANTDACFLPESERQKNSSATRHPIQDPSQAWQLLQSVRLILGFHPDQATEACVELAELLLIPVCIVPCCVFPSEFPDRRLLVETECGDGGATTTTARVRDYQQLLQYLQQKHPKLRKDTLAFHQTETSRNVVLYTLPQDLE